MDVKLRLTWKNVALWISWGLVFALYLAWPLTHLDAYLWTNDEGLYMQRAALTLALSPLWRQYLIFLAFPLAIVSGGGIVAAGRKMLRLRRGTWRQEGLRALWAVLTIVWLTAFGLNRWEKTRPKLVEGPEWSSDHLAARSFIEEKVPPDGFVATDDPLLALAAGRLVQPPFTEASKKQIEMGNFTTEGAMEAMLRYGSEAALFSTGRLILLPGFEEWVSEVATGRREFDELRAYRLDLPRREPDSTLARFENGIELRGYALSRGVLGPGDVLMVMLFWRCTDEVTEDNHVFSHLVHEEGGRWGQHDGPLQDGECPTSQWEQKELVVDVHRISLSPEAPPGTYFLTVGMYPWPSLERVPVFLPNGDRWPQHRAVVTEISVVSP